MSDVNDLIRAVARAHRLPHHPIARPAQVGLVNQVVVVGSGLDRYVLRTPLERSHPTQEYAVEAWCAQRARQYGVPTPEIIAVGVIDGIHYSIQEFVDGVSGQLLGSDLWSALGRYARLIAAIPVDDGPDGLFSRFGRDLSAAWAQHLTYNLNCLDDADPLLALGVYPRRQQPELRARIEWLRSEPVEFGLSHGDLALRNLVVPPGQAPILIDWGSAGTGPVPHTDLLNLLRDRDHSGDPDDDDIRAFSKAYGVPSERLDAQVGAMRLVSAIDLVRWARERRPDRLEQTIAAARTQLSRR